MISKSNSKIRQASVAGQFYPGNKSALLEMIDQLFASVKTETLPRNYHISGLIAPHAGYVFSGRQAAKAYRYLKDADYELACIISPSHREYFPGVSLYPGDAYKTPLGACPVHEKARELALSCDGVTSSFQGHRAEHALEVQLPFLQYMLGDLPVLPMVMGDQSDDSIARTADCLNKLYGTFKEKILFVASSDLSHFHSSDTALKMDGEFIELLSRADTDLIGQKLEHHDVEACGGGPILAVMKGLRISEKEIKVLGYSHSGEVLKDNDSVVGYTSAVMIKDIG